MKQKKILIISPYNPFAPILGASPKALAYRLAGLGGNAAISLMTFSSSSVRDTEIARQAGVVPFFVEPPDGRIERPRWIRLLHILSGRLDIFEHIRRMVASFIPHVVRLSGQEEFDLIHIEDIVIAPIARHLPIRTPKVIFFHNLLSLQYRRFLETRESAAARFAAFLEYLWIKRFETKMLRLFQHAVVLTRIEKEHASCLNKSIEITEIPLAVDTNEYLPDHSSVEHPSLAFSGTMSYPPNEEAVCFFLKHIFPDIARRYPKIRFYIAGRNPSKKIIALSNDNVIVTGEVQDILQYISKCAVFVVPLLNGGGMRFKILEAFALAKPVVSTPIGAQGINYTDGEDILIASDAGSFAEKVCHLLEDPARALRQGERARNMVEKNYSLEVVSEKWERLYEDLLTAAVNNSPRTSPRTARRSGR